MQIAGKWHTQGSAAQTAAALHVDGEEFTLNIEGGSTYYGKLDEINVSDRLGNIERKLTFTDGSVFVTDDNDAIDQAFKQQSKVNSFIHTLESHMHWVVVALLLTIAFSFSFFKWGLPWISTTIAETLPHKTNEIISEHTLDFLDEYIFEPSKLDTATIKQIREHFSSTLVPLANGENEINYQLHFREWSVDEEAIPNALALPSGDIILTDRFVELSENQQEIDSVLLHEIGHVEYRHTLKTLVQSTLVATIIMVATGDSNGLADMGIGLGSLLVSSSYSRNHETEADEYAFKKMLQTNIDPAAFSTIIKRITEDLEGKQEDKPAGSKSDNDEAWLDYLSSHPSTFERIELAKRYSLCYKNKLTICDESGSPDIQIQD